MKTKLPAAILITAFISFTSNSFSQKSNIDFHRERIKESSRHLKPENRGSKQLALTSLNDSAYTWKWDTTKSKWSDHPVQRVRFVYDGKYNMISGINQDWINSAWVNNFEFTHTYDANNNIIKSVSRWWKGSWVNSNLDNYTYDSSNNLVYHLIQTWKGSAWVNGSQYNHTFNSKNKLASTISQIWNDSVWVNTSQDIIAYDANNNLTSIVNKSWENGAWVDYAHADYTYDTNNNLISIVWQNWTGGSWVNASRRISTYDINGNETNTMWQIWANGAWINYLQIAGTYDLNDNNLSTVLRYFNENGKVSRGDSTYNYYHKVNNSSINLPVAKSTIKIYPNPSNGQFYIENKNNSPLQIDVYNVAGELILTQKTNIVNMSSSPKGIYFLKVSDGETTHSQKIIIH